MNGPRRGKHWETISELFLHRKGLKTLAKNFTTRMGEIDLIMEDGNCVVFVEVRYRKNNNFGSGAETVGSSKQFRISRAAAIYLSQNPHRAVQNCRFDVISMKSRPGLPEIDWIKNAFESSIG